MLKKCFHCGSSNVVKNGLRGRKQMYKCKDCKKQFVGGKRRDKSQVITDYIEGKQTQLQLASAFIRSFCKIDVASMPVKSWDEFK